MNEQKKSITEILKARAAEIAPKGPMPKTNVEKVTFQRYQKPGGSVSGGFLIATVAALYLTLPVQTAETENGGQEIRFETSMPNVKINGFTQDNSDERNTKVLGMIRVGSHEDPNCGFFAGGIPCGTFDGNGELRFLSSLKSLIEPIIETCSTKEGYEECLAAHLIISYKEKTYININMAEYGLPLVFYVADRGGLQLDVMRSEWGISTSPGHVHGMYGTNSSQQMFRGWIVKNDRSITFARELFAKIAGLADKDLKECPRVSSAADTVKNASGRASAFKAAAGATSATASAPKTADDISFDDIGG